MDLIEAIKFVLENDLFVDNGDYCIFRCDEKKKKIYVVCNNNDNDVEEFYEEFECVDEAITCFFKMGD